MEDNKNVVQHTWGYELIWAKAEDYLGKILFFNANGAKTPFYFSAKTSRTYFANAGSFKIRWIDTKDGNIYEQSLQEGQVWECPKLMPASFQAQVENSSLTEVSNGQSEDTHVVIKPEMF